MNIPSSWSRILAYILPLLYLSTDHFETRRDEGWVGHERWLRGTSTFLKECFRIVVFLRSKPPYTRYRYLKLISILYFKNKWKILIYQFTKINITLFSAQRILLLFTIKIKWIMNSFKSQFHKFFERSIY